MRLVRTCVNVGLMVEASFTSTVTSRRPSLLPQRARIGDAGGGAPGAAYTLLRQPDAYVEYKRPCASKERGE